MDLPGLGEDLKRGSLAACNIGNAGSRGFQVSVRRPGGDGWEVYYGTDLADTIERAVNAGPQSPDTDDDWSHLV